MNNENLAIYLKKEKELVSIETQTDLVL
jgi:hypothetical protein